MPPAPDVPADPAAASVGPAPVHLLLVDVVAATRRRLSFAGRSRGVTLVPPPSEPTDEVSGVLETDVA
jgi:hypothetical protein